MTKETTMEERKDPQECQHVLDDGRCLLCGLDEEYLIHPGSIRDPALTCVHGRPDGHLCPHCAGVRS